FNKREKLLIVVFLFILTVSVNTYFVYKPMKDKEKELNNIVNKIEVSKKIVNEKISNEIKRENIIIDIENYLKKESIVNYIKKENEEDNNTTLNIKFSGLPDSVTGLIENINSISKNIYLNDIELYMADENNIDCKMKITIYTY
ncbi:MAG: hypothetical protein ACRDB0_02200, partial [Paraclostridium sp.]